MKDPQTNFCAAFVSASKPASLRFTSIPITPGHETSGRDLLGTSLLNGKIRVSLDSRCDLATVPSLAERGKLWQARWAANHFEIFARDSLAFDVRAATRQIARRMSRRRLFAYKRSDNSRSGMISERDGILLMRQSQMSSGKFLRGVIFDLDGTLSIRCPCA